MNTELCEVCGEIGGFFSSYIVDADNEHAPGHGVWICPGCEAEAESNQYYCPCGCDGPDNCVYYSPYK